MRIKQLDIPCKGYQCGIPSDGYEYDCKYENSCDFSCDECVCNFGYMNPVTGKRINFILRKIQNKRAMKYYSYKYCKEPLKQRILLPLVKLLNHVLRIVNAGLKKKG